MREYKYFFKKSVVLFAILFNISSLNGQQSIDCIEFLRSGALHNIIETTNFNSYTEALNSVKNSGRFKEIVIDNSFSIGAVFNGTPINFGSSQELKHAAFDIYKERINNFRSETESISFFKKFVNSDSLNAWLRCLEIQSNDNKLISQYFYTAQEKIESVALPEQYVILNAKINTGDSNDLTTLKQVVCNNLENDSLSTLVEGSEHNSQIWITGKFKIKNPFESWSIVINHSRGGDDQIKCEGDAPYFNVKLPEPRLSIFSQITQFPTINDRQVDSVDHTLTTGVVRRQFGFSYLPDLKVVSGRLGSVDPRAGYQGTYENHSEFLDNGLAADFRIQQLYGANYRGNMDESRSHTTWAHNKIVAARAHRKLVHYIINYRVDGQNDLKTEVGYMTFNGRLGRTHKSYQEAIKILNQQ